MWIRAKYGTSGRLGALRDVYGDVTLGDLTRKVFISAFLLNDENDPKKGYVPERMWKAKFFHNITDDYAHVRAVDAVMMSSAAPLFFPIYENCIDGGMVANNPSVCALAEAIENGLAPLERIVVLSVGTGKSKQYEPSMGGDWGLLQWKMKPIEILASEASELAHFQCKQLLGKKYRRLNPRLSQPIGLDDVANIPDLLMVADSPELEGFQETLQFVKSHWSAG